VRSTGSNVAEAPRYSEAAATFVRCFLAIFESGRDRRHIRPGGQATQSSFIVSSAEIPFPSTKPLASRALSALELLFGAFFVIGHNVFHIVPNEVIVLCVLGLLSVRLRDGGWSAMGFTRPVSWRRIFLIALAAAGVRILLGQFVIEPVTGFFWPAPSAPALANEIAGNVKLALLALLLVWTFAAFGEEIAYRGYLLTRAADIGRRSKIAYWLGIVFVSILFGYGHYYKGPSGIVDSGTAGLVLGAAYMLAGRNLWACILTHGFIDTFAVIDAFFAWSK
jgi:CAAX protease family protein